jgi:hypothetical protein
MDVLLMREVQAAWIGGVAADRGLDVGGAGAVISPRALYFVVYIALTRPDGVGGIALAAANWPTEGLHVPLSA